MGACCRKGDRSEPLDQKEEKLEEPVLVKSGDQAAEEHAAKRAEDIMDGDRVDSEDDILFKEKAKLIKSSNETANVHKKTPTFYRPWLKCVESISTSLCQPASN